MRFSLGSILILALLASMIGCGQRSDPILNNGAAPKNDFEKEAILRITPAKVDFGQVPQAGKKELTIQVSNRSEQTVEVAAISTSCPCLTVNLTKKQFLSSESTSAKLLLDLSDEPAFIGGLTIEVTAKAPDGTIVLNLEANVEVCHPISK